MSLFHAAAGGKDVSSRTSTREDDLELPLFDFETIAAATDNFSDDNKLGEGGFGPVYKVRYRDRHAVGVTDSQLA